MSRQLRKHCHSNPARVEQLEVRSMLAGHALAGFSSSLAGLFAERSHATQAVAHVASRAQINALDHVFAGFYSHSYSGSSEATTSFAGDLTSTGAGAGTAKYTTTTEDGVTTSKFTVSVTGAAKSTDLEVFVNGVDVGTLSTDGDGAGTLTFSTNPGTDEKSFPDNFPSGVGNGATVVVGTAVDATDAISGTLATSTTTHHGCGGQGDSDGESDAVRTHLKASLTDSVGTATGTAKFRSYTEDGTTESKLKVSVTGAAVSTELTVFINGASVGTLTTDSTGAGKTTITTGLPTIAAGSTISVGTSADTATLSGTFDTASLRSVRRFSRFR